MLCLIGVVSEAKVNMGYLCIQVVLGCWDFCWGNWEAGILKFFIFHKKILAFSRENERLLMRLLIIVNGGKNLEGDYC